MRSVRDIPILENIPVLVRAALNVPVEDGKVINDYRLRRALPTIEYLNERNARIILISQLGEKGTETLEPVAGALRKLVPGVSFCSETVGPRARKAIRDLLPGGILVLENLRRNRGEKESDREFSRELAALADVFVQDSFDTSHRMHASIVGVPEFLPSYAGLLVEDEIRELSKARSPATPSLAVVGGAKFSTKKAALAALLKTYDRVFVGGALANEFLATAGHEVGKSLVSSAEDTVALTHLLANPKIVLPVDSLVVPAGVVGSLNPREGARVAGVGEVGKEEVILDHGPETIRLLEDIAAGAKTILWNGPLGNYEHGFVDATNAFARAVAASRAYSVVGGGDTVAAIEELGLLPKFSFVSTGGGAMLEFLAHGTLPGLDALK